MPCASQAGESDLFLLTKLVLLSQLACIAQCAYQPAARSSSFAVPTCSDIVSLTTACAIGSNLGVYDTIPAEVYFALQFARISAVSLKQQLCEMQMVMQHLLSGT